MTNYHNESSNSNMTSENKKKTDRADERRTGMTNVVGRWTDHNGRQEIITFSGRWGEYSFDRDEQIRLLNGEVITIEKLVKGKVSKVSGHLQFDHGFYKFVPTFGAEYDEAPTFHRPTSSDYPLDSVLESIIHGFVDRHYYKRAIDKGEITDYEYDTDERSQRRGIDVKYTKDHSIYIVDEKSQARYIYDPRNSFVLELLNGNSGKIGWFVNEELETTYYMFLWPYTQETIIDTDTIERVDYALVKKSALIELVKRKTGYDTKGLLEYAERIEAERGRVEGAKEVTNRQGDSVGYKYRPDGFDNDLYIRYSNHIPERPINLVISKRLLEQVSEEHGTIE